MDDPAAVSKLLRFAGAVWVGGVVMEGGVLKGYYGLYEHVPGILKPPVADFAVLLVRK